MNSELATPGVAPCTPVHDKVPSFDWTEEDLHHWQQGFGAFFQDADIEVEWKEHPHLWSEGWFMASDVVIALLHARLPSETAVPDYGLAGVGFAAWRAVILTHDLVHALEDECRRALDFSRPYQLPR